MVLSAYQLFFCIQKHGHMWLPHGISRCQIQYCDQWHLDNVKAECRLPCGKSCIPVPIPAWLVQPQSSWRGHCKFAHGLKIPLFSSLEKLCYQTITSCWQICHKKARWEGKLAGSVAIEGSLVQTHFTTCCYYLAGLWCMAWEALDHLLFLSKTNWTLKCTLKHWFKHTFFPAKKEILITDASQQCWRIVWKKQVLMSQY